jgi:hypothetical protein
MNKITTGYAPRFHQAALHTKLKRFNVLVAHRRFGKTVFTINEKIDRAVRLMKKNPQYAYVGPSYGQVKRVAWDYMKDYTRQLPGVKFNEAELRVDIPRPHLGDRIRIMLLSGENPDALRGLYLDGATLDEYAEMNPVIWSQVLRPALSDRLGWANFIGTPKGKNHFYDIHERAKELMASNSDWFTQILRASETGVIPQSELKDARNTMSSEEYAQEYECDFGAAMVGAYYGVQMSAAEKEGRICSVPYDPNFEVNTFWDLGVDDHTAIWFGQECGRELHWIDYVEAPNRSFAEWAKDLKERPYTYGKHHLPHDIMAREISTNKTRLDTLKELLGGKNLQVVDRHGVEDRINAVRLILSRSYFDRLKCKPGIEALQNYQRKWDPHDKTFVSKPMHNWASHGADAFGQGAIGYRDLFRRNVGNLPREANNKFSIYDF